jgi:hypothetical protein
MNYSEAGRGDARAQYPKEIIDLIQKSIPEMGDGEQVKKIQFGHNPEGGSVWIARNAESIIDPEVVSVDGVDYYFGMLKADGAE